MTQMHHDVTIWKLVLAISLLAAGAQGQQSNVDLPRYPSISPDGSQIVFSWRGDLWKVPSAGGSAQRLTSHPQDDLMSAWSRDGSRIAFTSTRSGSMNVHLMQSDGTGLSQVTNVDRPIALVGFGVDEQGNEVILLTARPDPEAYPGFRPMMVSPAGGDLARVHDAYGVFAVVSPDGSKVLFNRGGAPWSRRHYRGPDNRDVWLFDRATRQFRQLTKSPGNDGRARWVDNDSFVYASDREDDTVNLYMLDVGGDEKDAKRLTNFKGTDVEEFDISADGKVIVLASWDKLYTLDLSRGGAEPRALAIRGSEDEQDISQLKEINRAITESALSPDGKTIAYVAYGEVYVRGTEKHGPTRRVTTSGAKSRERDIAWSPDGATLYFSGDESGADAIYAATVTQTRSEVKKAYEASSKPPTSSPATEPATGPATRGSRASTQPAEGARWTEAVSFEINQISASDQGDRGASPSPDGKLLAFRRGVGNLMLMDLATKEVRPLLEGWSSALDWRWSPDSRHLAYVTQDSNFNSDIWIVPADASQPAVNITQHPDNDSSPRWSADGKILAFLSDRANNESDVWMVWLDKKMEGLTAPEIDQYFKDAAAAAKKREPLKKPTTKPATQPATDEAGEKTAPQENSEKLDLNDAYLRLARVTSLAGDERNLELSPAGDKYIFTATIGAARSLYSLDRDATEPRKLAPAVSVQHLSLGGDQVVFVEQGRGGVVKLAGTPEVEYLDISDRMRIDLAAQSMQKFNEAARTLGSEYYDPKMAGLDWEAVTKKYAKLAGGARTADEFDHVAAKLVGELNGSHLGINSPDAPNPQTRPYGRLGATVERHEDGFRVTRILPESPAAKSATPLKVGDVIVSIDGEAVSPHVAFEAMLAGKPNREVAISIRRTINGESKDLTLLITPITPARLDDLFYDNWRQDSAKKVEEWSGGKLGYIHIESMGQASLDVFERDLYAAAQGKKGLIIDVRNNGGGWTTDRLLASIMYPRHAWTVARGQNSSDHTGYPQDRLFIQRFDGPVNMLCNEKSFSNAEIISHAFKTLKRGTLVGQQTAGGVISTGGTTLVDGTSVRIPFRGWFLPDGTNMELHGAMPDVVVVQTPEDESRDYDAQLRAAVEDLLKRVD